MSVTRPLRVGPDALCMISAAQEDELGRLYLTNVDFLKNGVPASIIATLVRDVSYNRARSYLILF